MSNTVFTGRFTGSSIGICESRIWYSTGTYDGSVLDYGRIVVFRCSRTIASTGRAYPVVMSGGIPAYYVQGFALMHASPPPSIYASRHVDDPSGQRAEGSCLEPPPPKCGGLGANLSWDLNPSAACKRHMDMPSDICAGPPLRFGSLSTVLLKGVWSCWALVIGD
ncbi:uncharacterized protein DS421_11g323630 [Arachis hypogaea]|nr:uncharacterized protein DS421_11g323630 [Arachis hypogaea]